MERLRGCKCIVSALLICILYATSDETHQIFVVGRSAQVRDVIIDGAGVAVGILIYFSVPYSELHFNISNDIIILQNTFGGENMDKEILELLKTINNKLDENTQILNEHTQILRALEHASESSKY